MLLLIFVLIGFAHALYLFLRSEPVGVTEYSGPVVYANTNGTAEVAQNNTNEFATFFLSLRSVYFFLAGDFSPLQNYTLTGVDFMKVIFYAFTSIFMFNILIALLANSVGDSTIKGKQNWLSDVWFDFFFSL